MQHLCGIKNLSHLLERYDFAAEIADRSKIGAKVGLLQAGTFIRVLDFLNWAQVRADAEPWLHPLSNLSSGNA